MQARKNPYHKDKKPDGCIQLAIAENKTNIPMIRNKLRNDCQDFPEEWALEGYGRPCHGLPHFKQELKLFLERNFRISVIYKM